MHHFHFYKPIEIRYGDLDPQGHVNNAKYLTYLEQARIAYVGHLGLWDGASFLDIGFILADARITFVQPLHFGQKVQVGVRSARLGNKSLTMDYTIEDSQDRQEYATASTVVVTYDYHSRQTISIPESWRQRIVEFENLSTPTA